MFTGIIESMAEVVSLTPDPAGNVHIGFRSSLAKELKIDQSLAHDGVCLTVVEINGDVYYVDVIPETLKRSRFGKLAIGDHVNLERAMRMDRMLDGHMVQGHVDSVGVLEKRDDEEYFTISYPDEYSGLVVEKGSISINGVSLTVATDNPGNLSVALIPYTLEHTNLGSLQPGDEVNLEFDILGKYIQKNIAHFAAR